MPSDRLSCLYWCILAWVAQKDGLSKPEVGPAWSWYGVEGAAVLTGRARHPALSGLAVRQNSFG